MRAHVLRHGLGPTCGVGRGFVSATPLGIVVACEQIGTIDALCVECAISMGVRSRHSVHCCRDQDVQPPVATKPSKTPQTVGEDRTCPCAHSKRGADTTLLTRMRLASSRTRSSRPKIYRTRPKFRRTHPEIDPLALHSAGLHTALVGRAEREGG